MHTEKQRSFHHDRRIIESHLEDEHGTKHIVQMHVGNEKCPMCQRAYPSTAGEVDFEALVEQVKTELEAEKEKALAIFRKHGWQG